MEAIVLVGGLGTRLRSVVSAVPKPMAPILGRPFLTYLLNKLKKEEVTRVILACGYKKDVIKSYYGTSFNGIELIYSEEDSPLKTGGAIKQALSFCTDDYVIVCNGDTYFDCDYQLLRNFAQIHQSDIAISATTVDDNDRYGSLILKEDRVISFVEKGKANSNIINCGVYCINKKIFTNVDEKCFSFEEFMQSGLNSLSIFAFVQYSYFIDIGVPKDYARASSDFLNMID
jgi:D-glycero-alpha-D-manno-heptose 1-phosphate guanylyltransferase